MADYQLVRDSDFEGLRQAVRRVQSALDEVQRELDAIERSGQLTLPDMLAEQTGAEADNLYRIDRGTPYADVVAEEVDRERFTLSEAWEEIEALVIHNAQRPRDGLRVSLDRDERFERVESSGREVEYRRVEREADEGG